VREDGPIHRLLRGVDPDLPKAVSALIEKENREYPRWEKHLLDSQLDVDRLDYLRRDSLFTGAGYGNFDWYRLLHSFELHGQMDANRGIVWSEKSAFAIEEYVFARFYMYWNVYFHKTTRGFEQMLIAMWRRAKQLRAAGTDVNLVPALADFWNAGEQQSVEQYLRIEEFTVLAQIQAWASHPDRSLSDLANRFLKRERFVAIDAPVADDPLDARLPEWEVALAALVGQRVEYQPAEMYCLKDNLKGKYSEPYFPEKEADEQAVGNAIRLIVDGQPVEVSELLPRLKPIIEKPRDRFRYYVPKDVEAAAKRLRSEWRPA